MIIDGALSLPDMSQEGIPEGFGMAPAGPPMVQPPTPMPQQAAPGFFDRMGQFSRDNPGLLMAAAAGIGKGTSMGNMFSSIQEHQQYQDGLKAKKEAQDYALKMKQDQLEESKRLNSAKIDNYTASALKSGTAKVTNMGNGIVSVIAPGQTTPTYMTNKDYQDFAIQKIDETGAWNVSAAGLKVDSAPPTAAMEQHSLELRKTAETTDATIGRFERALNEINTKGTPGLLALPGVQGIAQIFGTDSSVVLRHLNELKVDAAFAGRAQGQGAISNFEREMLLSDLPAPTASLENWKEYINDRLTTLKKLQAFAQSEVEKNANKPKNGLSSAQAFLQNGGVKGVLPTAPAPVPGDTAVPPAVAPAPPPTAAPKLAQAYPPSFKPPSNGRAPKEDQLAILQGERATEAAKPASAQREANLAALDREIAAAGGGKAKAAAPAAAPAATTRPPLTAFKKG